MNPPRSRPPSRSRRRATPQHQAGVVAVEFALIALFAFFPLLMGIMEFGRYLYVSVTMQEVTRRAARDQTVKWADQLDSIQRAAIFKSGSSGTAKLPAGDELASTSVTLTFFNTVTDAKNGTNPIATSGATAYDNYNKCLANDPACIKFVKATLLRNNAPIYYVPMTGILPSTVPLPGSTIIIPAESLGLTS